MNADTCAHSCILFGTVFLGIFCSGHIMLDSVDTRRFSEIMIISTDEWRYDDVHSIAQTRHFRQGLGVA
jgi:hypothetical protein